jgi:hypothetical protein
MLIRKKTAELRSPRCEANRHPTWAIPDLLPVTNEVTFLHPWRYPVSDYALQDEMRLYSKSAVSNILFSLEIL